MERAPLELSQFSVNLRKHVDPSSPVPLRMMAAKGVIPMAPQEMLLVLYQLSFDADKRVQSAGTDTLANSPPDILQTALSSPVQPAVLDWMASALPHQVIALELIVLNGGVSDATIARIATQATSELCDLIADNQVRLLREPKIIEALYMNVEARMSTVDKIVDLARRNGVSLDGLPALRPLMESNIPLVEDAPMTEDEADEVDSMFGQYLSEALLDEDIEQEAVEDDDADDDEEEQAKSASHKGRQHFISKLRIPQKIRLAILGSRDDRNLLIRDSNRLVHMAAVASPKVNDADALFWSNNRSLPETVIEYIAQKREWIRMYQVKVNLTANPKLPLRTALRLLTHLHPRDLTRLAGNRNVSFQLQRQAKALGQKRRGGGRG